MRWIFNKQMTRKKLFLLVLQLQTAPGKNYPPASCRGCVFLVCVFVIVFRLAFGSFCPLSCNLASMLVVLVFCLYIFENFAFNHTLCILISQTLLLDIERWRRWFLLPFITLHL